MAKNKRHIPTPGPAREYRLTHQEIETRLRRFRAVLILVALVVAGGFLSVGIRHVEEIDGFEPAILTAIILFVVAVAAWNVFQELNRQRQSIYSLTFLVKDDFILRRRAGLPDLLVTRDKIRGIIEKDGKAIYLYVENLPSPVALPVGLENFEELSAQLRAWAPPESESKLQAATMKYWIAGVTALIGYLTAAFHTEPAAGIFGYGLMAAALIWLFFRLRSDPETDERIRKNLWKLLLLALGSLYLLYELFQKMSPD